MSHKASFGQLALTYCGKFLPLEVLQAPPYYIGTRDTEGPVSRESREYFRSHAGSTMPSKEAAGPTRHS